MALDRKAQAALALHRFGFGPAHDQIRAIAGDPRGALVAELGRDQHRLAAALPSSAEAARAVFDFRARQQARQKLAERLKKEPEGTRPETNPVAAALASLSADLLPEGKGGEKQPPLPQQLVQNEAKLRFDAAIGSEIGFVERLVWFWSNHFCISAAKIPSMAGAYEREAIRPHVLGSFADMLQAAESHPAMLFYLDNVESMGAESIAGINRDKGLNENLAREILELHTLGVRSGYSQADVTSFANVLTGWTWIGPGEPAHGGEFVFVARLHEPGAQTVLGKRYPENGVEQGRAVLADLARHPATARHIAQKLAGHFVADEPPPTLVKKLEQTFVATDGDLKEVAMSLLTAEEVWTPQRTKLKRPSEWLAGALRATGVRTGIPVGRIMGAQAMLGEALWRPPAPNGFPDTEAAWIDGVPRRLDIANEFAMRLPPDIEPTALLDSALGPLASSDTRSTVRHAESRSQALALLLMAPEFLRR